MKNSGLSSWGNLIILVYELAIQFCMMAVVPRYIIGLDFFCKSLYEKSQIEISKNDESIFGYGRCLLFLFYMSIIIFRFICVQIFSFDIVNCRFIFCMYQESLFTKITILEIFGCRIKPANRLWAGNKILF